LYELPIGCGKELAGGAAWFWRAKFERASKIEEVLGADVAGAGAGCWRKRDFWRSAGGLPGGVVLESVE
tara:strand:- start:559 stop:765 length:207 start_codon:yes stop_codon:yes gene_type:complete